MGQTGKEYSDKARKVNEVIEALSHHLRREVVHYFENYTSDEPAALEDLASHIAQRVPEMIQENAALHLAYTHVPKLQSHDWVEYDPRTQQVDTGIMIPLRYCYPNSPKCCVKHIPVGV